MPPKNTPPTLSPSRKRSAPKKSKIIAAVFVVMIILALAVLYYERSMTASDDDQVLTDHTPTNSELRAAADSARPDTLTPDDHFNDNAQNTQVPQTTQGDLPEQTKAVTLATDVPDANMPDPDTIINAPLPESDRLAKEEIDRLNDEHERMIAQETAVNEQIEMNTKLSEMKEEQIKLLEAQIRTLENSAQ